MCGFLDKKIIRKEISLLHFVLLLTGKLFIGVGIGIMIASSALPYSFPLILIGVAVLLPTLYHLLKIEKKEEVVLKKKLR